MDRIQSDQLKIYYYFMLSDGQCTEDEMSKLSYICREMKIKNSEKNDVIESADELKAYPWEDRSEKAISAIKAILEDSALSYDWYKHKQIETMWNLINLAYADDEYSEPERKVISFLKDTWEMDENIILELVDTADTILMLTNKIDWIINSEMTDEQKQEKTQKADQDIIRIHDYIKDTISEVYGIDNIIAFNAK